LQNDYRVLTRNICKKIRLTTDFVLPIGTLSFLSAESAWHYYVAEAAVVTKVQSFSYQQLSSSNVLSSLCVRWELSFEEIHMRFTQFVKRITFFYSFQSTCYCWFHLTYSLVHSFNPCILLVNGWQYNIFLRCIYNSADGQQGCIYTF